MGFVGTVADPDVYRRANAKPDGFKYYEYILVYVDDVLIISHDADMIISMQYKLRMFGIPLEAPATVFCDNQGVVKNTSIPESVLTKKHNAVNYHAVREAAAAGREAAAAGVLEVVKEDTQTNLADLFTKVLPADRRRELLGSVLYNL